MGIGCGGAFLDDNERFRCVDCGVILHKECAVQHFKESDPVLSAAIATADSVRIEAEAVLRDIEWVDTSGGEYQSECPSCRAAGPDWRSWPREKAKQEPHKPDCRLAALLARLAVDDHPSDPKETK